MVKITILSHFLPNACAWISKVTCLPGFEWAFNSLGQSPCVVAGYLASQCYGKPWTVDPIPPGQGPYNPPGTTSAASLCRCNAIDYNLVSACSACQTGLIGTWQTWIQYCPSNLVTLGGKYPESVPAGTEIPTFAFWDTSSPGVGIFTVAGAQEFRADHTKRSGHAGAIAGGVIGGVVGLALLCFAAALIFSRKLRETLKISKPATTDGATAESGGFSSEAEKRESMRHSAGDPANYPISEPDTSLPGSPQAGARRFHLPQRFVRHEAEATQPTETYSGVPGA